MSYCTVKRQAAQARVRDLEEQLKEMKAVSKRSEEGESLRDYSGQERLRQELE